MNIKFGTLTYDEPKKAGFLSQRPRKLLEISTNPDSDLYSVAVNIADSIYDSLKGKTKFRFYYETDSGYCSTYQVNFDKEARSFFEEEIYDDLASSHKIKRYCN